MFYYCCIAGYFFHQLHFLLLCYHRAEPLAYFGSAPQCCNLIVPKFASSTVFKPVTFQVQYSIKCDTTMPFIIILFFLFLFFSYRFSRFWYELLLKTWLTFMVSRHKLWSPSWRSFWEGSLPATAVMARYGSSMRSCMVMVIAPTQRTMKRSVSQQKLQKMFGSWFVLNYKVIN